MAEGLMRAATEGALGQWLGGLPDQIEKTRRSSLERLLLKARAERAAAEAADYPQAQAHRRAMEAARYDRAMSGQEVGALNETGREADIDRMLGRTGAEHGFRGGNLGSLAELSLRKPEPAPEVVEPGESAEEAGPVEEAEPPWSGRERIGAGLGSLAQRFAAAAGPTPTPGQTKDSPQDWAAQEAELAQALKTVKTVHDPIILELKGRAAHRDPSVALTARRALNRARVRRYMGIVDMLRAERRRMNQGTGFLDQKSGEARQAFQELQQEKEYNLPGALD